MLAKQSIYLLCVGKTSVDKLCYIISLSPLKRHLYKSNKKVHYENKST